MPRTSLLILSALLLGASGASAQLPPHPIRGLRYEFTLPEAGTARVGIPGGYGSVVVETVEQPYTLRAILTGIQRNDGGADSTVWTWDVQAYRTDGDEWNDASNTTLTVTTHFVRCKPPEVPSVHYTKPGETWASIAKSLGLSERDLRTWNYAIPSQRAPRPGRAMFTSEPPYDIHLWCDIGVDSVKTAQFPPAEQVSQWTDYFSKKTCAELHTFLLETDPEPHGRLDSPPDNPLWLYCTSYRGANGVLTVHGWTGCVWSDRTSTSAKIWPPYITRDGRSRIIVAQVNQCGNVVGVLDTLQIVSASINAERKAAPKHEVAAAPPKTPTPCGWNINYQLWAHPEFVTEKGDAPDTLGTRQHVNYLWGGELAATKACWPVSGVLRLRPFALHDSVPTTDFNRSVFAGGDLDMLNTIGARLNKPLAGLHPEAGLFGYWKQGLQFEAPMTTELYAHSRPVTRNIGVYGRVLGYVTVKNHRLLTDFVEGNLYKSGGVLWASGEATLRPWKGTAFFKVTDEWRGMKERHGTADGMAVFLPADTISITQIEAGPRVGKDTYLTVGYHWRNYNSNQWKERRTGIMVQLRHHPIAKTHVAIGAAFIKQKNEDPVSGNISTGHETRVWFEIVGPSTVRP